MTDFLVNKFIKDSDKVQDKKVRERYGVFSGVVGIICNIFLCIGKFVVGSMTSSISITADAFNNLFDAGSSVVSIIGFKMAGKPADKAHPFGHGRIEYVAGLIVSIIIILVGVELMQTSVDKIVNPQEIEYNIVSIVVMGISVVVKMWMSFFNKSMGKRIKSNIILATSQDSKNDAIATSVILLSILVHMMSSVNIDGYMGILVAGFILLSGINAVKETVNPLLGQPADKDMVKAIESKVKSYDGIVGVHDLLVHNYGVGKCIISLHAEVPQDIDFLQIHETIDTIEREINQEFGGEVIIHMDPIATDDTHTKEVLNLLKTLIALIDENITIHDFRMVEGGNQIKLIFDIVVPYNFRMSDEQVEISVTKAMKSIDEKYDLVMHVDKPFM